MLIFLDYDGVLQTSALPDFIDFEFLPALERILREFPKVDVVISSTHRYGFPLSTLKKLYSADLQGRVIGATPDLPEGRADGGRYAEIQKYLENTGQQSRPWIAIDDEYHLFPTNCPNLLVTSRYLGFDEATQKELRQRLHLNPSSTVLLQFGPRPRTA